MRTIPDPLAWIDPALDELSARSLRRDLRHHGSPAGPWIDLDVDGTPRSVLHLCSNGYLGLAEHPDVVAAAVAATRRYGTSSASSRLITGGQTPHRDLERTVAAWKRTEDAVLLSSGYLANLAIVTALVGAGDTIVSDELNHASIVDACRLSRAAVRVYRHGDVAHAGSLLADAPGRRLLITDGVFSMDGDLAPLPALCDVAERHGAAVVVDDAHGSGVLGEEGRGTVAHLGCEGRVHAVVGTLSKALASVGGYVATDRRLADWLRNRARPFIFDTALPASAPAAATAAIAVLRSDGDRRRRVMENATRLATALRGLGFEVPAVSAPIVPVVVGGNEAALRVMAHLLANDVLAVAIRPPSVPTGTARIRATVMSTHTDADLAHAIAAFASAAEVMA